MGITPARRTIHDVARAAHVHPSTVSRALNGGPGVTLRPETRARVLAAASRLGYRPSGVARSLRLRRTLTLGMLVPDIANPFFPRVIKGAEEAARERGYSLVLCDTADLPEREAEYLRVLREREVDGLLIASSRMADATIGALRAEGFPFVLVNRGARTSDDLAVLVDNEAGIAEAVAHLAALGHRRVAHLAGPQTTTTGVERADGFRAAVRAHGLDPDPALVVEVAAFDEGAGRRQARAVLALDRRPTAIVAANDLIAIGALRAAREAGLRVPRDLSLVGFNDIPDAELIEPPLTTVRVPQEEMGARAAALLVARLAGDEIREPRIVLPARLVVRSSTADRGTARAAGAHGHVATAAASARRIA